MSAIALDLRELVREVRNRIVMTGGPVVVSFGFVSSPAEKAEVVAFLDDERPRDFPIHIKATFTYDP